jgi:hypothetical protein
VNGKKLFLGVCLNGHTPGPFIGSLVRGICQVRFDGVCLHPGGIQLFMARNTIAADFLRSDCTHLLFIDSDLVFEPKDIKRLCSHDVDIVGGLYPIKQEGPLVICANDYAEPRPVQPSGLQSVRYVGTGFVLIARRVFEMMRATDPDLEFILDYEGAKPEWNFFRSEIRADPHAGGRRRYLTEDWTFCQDWLDLGGEVHCDRGIFLKHIGQATFPLSYQWAELNTQCSSTTPVST